MINEIISYLKTEAAVLVVFCMAAVVFFSRGLLSILRKNTTYTEQEQQDTRTEARGRL